MLLTAADQVMHQKRPNAFAAMPFMDIEAYLCDACVDAPAGHRRECGPTRNTVINDSQ